MDQLSEAAGRRVAARPVASLGLPAVRAAVPAFVCLAVFEILAFRGGGFTISKGGGSILSTTPVVMAALLVLGLWAVTRPAMPRGRLVLVALLAFGAFAFWSGLSVLWSMGPDLTWMSFNDAAFYALLAVALVLARPGVVGLRVAAFGYLVAILPVAIMAFLSKTLPNVVTEAQSVARLQWPLGYWNVLAVALVMAVPVAVELAARPGVRVALRAASASAAAFLLVTFFFTMSRGGMLALAVAMVVYFVAARTRLGSLLSLSVAAVPVTLVLIHLRGLSTLYTGTDAALPNGDAAQIAAYHALQASQGHSLGEWTLVALVITFLLQFGIAWVQRRWQPGRTAVRYAGWSVLAIVIVVVIAGPLVYMSLRGGIESWISSHYRTFVSSSPVEQGDTSSRLLVISSNGRIQLYEEAFKGIPHHLLAGTGAGTFSFTNLRYRATPIVVYHAHSQWVNVLSELGIVGLAFFAVAILALVAAALRSLWRWRNHAERGLLAACFAGAAAFAFHMSFDWDWDMATATAIFLLLLTAVAAFGPDAGAHPTARDADEVHRADGEHIHSTRPRRLPLGAAVLLVGLPILVAVSWLFPYLSERALFQAVGQADSPTVAAASARRAHSLDPLAVQPLLTLSLDEENLGDAKGALATLREAAALQPQNFEVYYQTGMLLLADQQTQKAALEFRLALALNPLEPKAIAALSRIQ
jgi:hypothetical protein